MGGLHATPASALLAPPAFDPAEPAALVGPLVWATEAGDPGAAELVPMTAADTEGTRGSSGGDEDESGPEERDEGDETAESAV